MHRCNLRDLRPDRDHRFELEIGQRDETRDREAEFGPQTIHRKRNEELGKGIFVNQLAST